MPMSLRIFIDLHLYSLYMYIYIGVLCVQGKQTRWFTVLLSAKRRPRICSKSPAVLPAVAMLISSFYRISAKPGPPKWAQPRPKRAPHEHRVTDSLAQLRAQKHWSSASTHTHTPTEHSLEPTLRFPCINSALTSGVLLTVPHKLRTHQSWFPLLMVFLLWLNGSFVFPPAINHAIRIANGTVIPCDIWVWFYESKDTFFCHQRLRERLGNAHVPKDEACIWLNYDAS